jgi:hypothetical protein
MPDLKAGYNLIRMLPDRLRGYPPSEERQSEIR